MFRKDWNSSHSIARLYKNNFQYVTLWGILFQNYNYTVTDSSWELWWYQYLWILLVNGRWEEKKELLQLPPSSGKVLPSLRRRHINTFSEVTSALNRRLTSVTETTQPMLSNGWQCDKTGRFLMYLNMTVSLFKCEALWSSKTMTCRFKHKYLYPTYFQKGFQADYSNINTKPRQVEVKFLDYLSLGTNSDTGSTQISMDNQELAIWKSSQKMKRIIKWYICYFIQSKWWW